MEVLDQGTRDSLWHTMNVADAIALAILEHELIFRVVPRTQRMLHETVLAVVSETPETIAATGDMVEGIGKGVGLATRGTGAMIKDTGKGVGYAVPSILSLIGLSGG